MKDMMAHAALSDALLLGGRKDDFINRLDFGGRLIIPVRLHACPLPCLHSGYGTSGCTAENREKPFVTSH